MGKLFTLDEPTKAIITDALDDVISEFGKDCRLVYPPRWTRCGNCLWDASSQRSTNRWRTGGPMPFASGTSCPLCQGQGQRADEVAEVVRFKVEWEPRKFWYLVPNLNIRSAHSVCQTKGYMADLPKVNQCDHMIVQLPIEGFIQAKFHLIGAPISPGNIIQGRYWVATWEQRS